MLKKGADSEGHIHQEAEADQEDNSDNYSEKLFDQDTIEEEDFEIPAFLRKQKF